MDILVLGGKRIRDLAPEYENGTIRILTYTEVVARAESELQWLINVLKSAGDVWAHFSPIEEIYSRNFVDFVSQSMEISGSVSV